MAQKKQKLVVTMGGGTGTFPVITALRNFPVDIASIVAVTDSGGSTGRIRDEFGFQPVGDLRQSLAALADEREQEWVRKTLLYRFDKGNGLKGHNLGNLILTALQDMTGDTNEALNIAEKMFRVRGDVIPVTEKNVDLEIEYEDGTKVVGEHTLDEPNIPNSPIKTVHLMPSAKFGPEALKYLKRADLIIVGPGDFYASLMAVLAVTDVREVFLQLKAKVAYLVNLMTRKSQTHGMSAQNHVDKIEETIGKELDFIVVNNESIEKSIVKHYATEEEYEVVDDLGSNQKVIRAPLASQLVSSRHPSDNVPRSLLRHDAKKLQPVLKKILKMA